ncbi:putative aldouronate transport system permease protein [Paenibacillus taihuensis]|uniref:Putative aldouronate transport system permease protein n=1 Tax=Paenibacillus taihuensis TaxID=1156355 RepID=A0A3D9QC69_9BACL|nr:ABC transporter permease subunit [Paenibacillus taihuensis]REE57575.1 putative aldouronate transport system permease protein [Paenibacillus taihuensis]
MQGAVSELDPVPSVVPSAGRSKLQRVKRELNRGKYVYLMLLPVMLYYLIFQYLPMVGIVISFQNYAPGLGFFESKWVGFKHFIDFFNGYYFWRLIKNTLLLNFWLLVFGFPAPILLALLLNEVRSALFKRTVQTVTYIPHFISMVVIVGMIKDFVSSDGLINQVRDLLGKESIAFLQLPEFFRTIYVTSDIWQSIGWSSIIYFAALSAVNPDLYEASEMDGAGRYRKIWHITLPAIQPTIVILLILTIGNLLSSGFEKILLLYQPLTYETSDVISTYVYRKGIQDSSFSFASAVGLFNTVVNFLLLIIANRISRKISESSLW